ncbi:MAG: hypothetical protein FJX92_03025 [Bacteroidetes bacterium]|nr:hypothetical protein [Bacteroidota bacterium]
MVRSFSLLALSSLILFLSCQKETSYEGDNTPAEGSLRSDVNGDCTPKTVNGTYTAGTALVSSVNTITCEVNVTKKGPYLIVTDTINGYYFSGTGTFTSIGSNTVTLRGNGTPFSAGVNNFIVSFDSTFCDIQVTVQGSGGGGGGGNAAFTLVAGGTPSNCASAVVNGTYTQNAALTAGNTVNVTVNVTTIGAYTLTASGGGMTFTRTGTFTTTGNQTVVLTGSGTPSTSGANTITFTAPNASCSFTVTVAPAGGGAAVGTLAGAPNACAPITVNGFYVESTATGTTNTIGVTVNITTAGTYNITTNTVNGLSFSSSGSLSVGNNQVVNLNASGTPTTAGNQTFTVTFGSSTCTFTVQVLPNDYFPRSVGSNWSYEINDAANDSLYRVVNPNTITALGSTFQIFQANDGTGLDSSGYYRRSGGDYFEWFDAGGYLGYDAPVWGQYIMVKDNVAANTVWKSNGFAGSAQGNNFNVRFSYKILQKDVPIIVTASVGSTTYSNVIVVEERLELEVTPGVWQDITGTIDFFGKAYYARGIGLILYEALNAAGVVQDKQELRRFRIL